MQPSSHLFQSWCLCLPVALCPSRAEARAKKMTYHSHCTVPCQGTPFPNDFVTVTSCSLIQDSAQMSSPPLEVYSDTLLGLHYVHCKIHMLKSKAPGPPDVTVFGGRVFKKAIKLKGIWSNVDDVF